MVYKGWSILKCVLPSQGENTLVVKHKSNQESMVRNAKVHAVLVNKNTSLQRKDILVLDLRRDILDTNQRKIKVRKVIRGRYNVLTFNKKFDHCANDFPNKDKATVKVKALFIDLEFVASDYIFSENDEISICQIMLFFFLIKKR
jgi:hypothetical protein